MNVLIANYHSFASNSAIHIFNVANALAELGVECTVCVPKDRETVRDLGTPRFKSMTFDEARKHFSNGAPSVPDVIHGWTPREVVRAFVQDLAGLCHAPYFVHLEDNEEVVLTEALGMSMDELLQLPEPSLDSKIPPGLSHPRRYRELLAGAAGVTSLIDKLLEFKPSETPGLVFWPAFDVALDWSRKGDPTLRAALGIGPTEHVIVYTGNVHASNRREVFSLYIAVALLNQRGLPVKLVRTGTDYATVLDHNLEPLRRHCIELGTRDRAQLPDIVALADVLVQPGGANPFNDYRFPSKLPEFFATGKPVVLPRSNIGHHLHDGVDCLLLQEGDALDIAAKVETLLRDQEMRRRIGDAGRRFAEEHFSWARAARELQKFYTETTARAPRTVAPRTDTRVDLNASTAH